MTGFAFPDGALRALAAAYPQGHMRLRHKLRGHPLLAQGALAALARRLPEDSIEYCPGTLPIGIAPEDTPRSTLSVNETIRTISENGSWMVLKNVEWDSGYHALMELALADIRPIVEGRTGRMQRREAFLFLTSPGAVTPFHMDPEHNILLQIQGSKTMTIFPPGDPELVPARQNEIFHLGGHRNLGWDEGFQGKGVDVHLSPGDAVLVPVKAPHYVKNGDEVSVSFSVTWRSERSIAESELHSLNRVLRKRRWPLVDVSACPEKQKLARLTYWAMRKLGDRRR
jgi:hypothetical protein